MCSLVVVCCVGVVGRLVCVGVLVSVRLFLLVFFVWVVDRIVVMLICCLWLVCGDVVWVLVVEVLGVCW